MNTPSLKAPAKRPMLTAKPRSQDPVKDRAAFISTQKGFKGTKGPDTQPKMFKERKVRVQADAFYRG